MHIESLSLRNFKCFGDTPTKIQMRPGITGFVGDNGSGKTSALEALKKLFSPVSSERQLQKSDVHFGHGEDSQSITEREIVIDVVFGFSHPNDTSHVFNDIFFNTDDESLKVRLILEGHYKRSESYEDDIEVKLYSVQTLDELPFGPDDERKIPLRSTTQFAEFVYIPAHRDSLGVTRHALKKVLKRIERSANWDDKIKNESQDFAENLEDSLNAATAIKTVAQDLEMFWKELHDGHYDATPLISVVATEFEQLIRELTLRFEKSPGGGRRQLDELSEGQISLLYFALTATFHKLESKMEAKNPHSLEGFKPLDSVSAPLTIFALEEPENHLAPFYLPRLIRFLENLDEETSSTQSFIASHSTGILKRIAPRNVRYFRNCRQSLVSDVMEIPLPDEGSENDKFLHQAILANPEIYFARLVIIGEGDSERIVIPRIAEALGVFFDPSFIAFVPMGGRHANHLWKLLKGLQIPFITLLDFDLGRYKAGTGRIKNAVDWLKDAGVELNFTSSDFMTNEELTPDNVQECVEFLRVHGVYYSTFLDLDMMMIESFPDAYKPNKIFNDTKGDSDEIAKAVFGNNGPGNIDMDRINFHYTKLQLFTYKNLFISRSKPASHYTALGNLSDEVIRKNCPEPLRALIEKAKTILTPQKLQI